MSVAEQLGVSEELLALVMAAVDHAIPTVREAGSFHPFLMANGGRSPLLRRFITEDLPAAVEAARKSVLSLAEDQKRYAIAFDGRLTQENRKYDAVIIEAGERTTDYGVTFGQMYSPASKARAFELVGNLTFLGRADNLFGNERAEKSLIYFRDPAFGLDEAYRVLKERGLSIQRDADDLKVQWQEGPVLFVKLTRGKGVQEEAAAVGEGTPHAKVMQGCDARFEISFDDLEEVLDEMNTLIEVQATLEHAVGGINYNTWNQRLSSAED